MHTICPLSFIYRSIHAFIHLPIHLSVNHIYILAEQFFITNCYAYLSLNYLAVLAFIHPSIPPFTHCIHHPSFHSSICLSVHPPIASIHLSVYPSIHLVHSSI